MTIPLLNASIISRPIRKRARGPHYRRIGRPIGLCGGARTYRYESIGIAIGLIKGISLVKSQWGFRIHIRKRSLEPHYRRNDRPISLPTPQSIGMKLSKTQWDLTMDMALVKFQRNFEDLSVSAP